jgi:hypothetical protein
LVVGDVAYVAAGDMGLRIIDVSDPTAPTLLGFYDTQGYTYDITVVGNIAYLAEGRANGDGYLRSIDVSDPTAPTPLGLYKTQNKARCVTVVDEVAYFAYENNGVLLIDVSNPAKPKLLGSYYTSWVNGISVVG